jgi:hypothetical protein
MIPRGIVDDLIRIGESGNAELPSSLTDPEIARQRLLCGHDPWLTTGRRLPEPRLQALIRGLVLFSQASGWSGGSVSPVIPLYAVYVWRFPLSEPSLTRWIVANRRNDYEPFGTTMHGNAERLSELREHQRARARKTTSNLQREELRRQEAARLRRLRESERATRNLANAVRRGDLGAVTALLAKGADWKKAVTSNGSLLALAEAAGRADVATYLRSKGVP